MRVWHAVVIVNLTFAIGVGLGYAGWGRRAEALDREVDAVRAQVERLEREHRACTTGGRAGEQQWDGRGIVRAVYPQLVVITHEEIRGFLPARTTSFRLAAPSRPAEIGIGEPIRFSLRGTIVDDAQIVALERW